MSVEDFFDTNVLVYMLDETDPSKHRRAESIVHLGNYSGTACISYQVVQETMSVVTRKLGWPTEAARRLLDEILIPLWQVNPTPALYRRALSLQGQYSFSLYDSLIVAAALEAGCVRLYSEDLQDGQQIQRLTIVNPFV